MNIYIIDASIILKWVAGDNVVTKKFSSILQEQQNHHSELYSVPLLPFEVANALRYSYEDTDEITLFYEDFLRLPIIVQPLDNVYLSQIMRMASKNNTTVYDTSYHFLALLTGGTFLTCDKKYFESAKHLGAIELLG